jgi:hypothetical protein
MHINSPVCRFFKIPSMMLKGKNMEFNEPKRVGSPINMMMSGLNTQISGSNDVHSRQRSKVFNKPLLLVQFAFGAIVNKLGEESGTVKWLQ